MYKCLTVVALFCIAPSRGKNNRRQFIEEHTGLRLVRITVDVIWHSVRELGEYSSISALNFLMHSNCVLGEITIASTHEKVCPMHYCDRGAPG